MSETVFVRVTEGKKIAWIRADLIGAVTGNTLADGPGCRIHAADMSIISTCDEGPDEFMRETLWEAMTRS